MLTKQTIPIGEVDLATFTLAGLKPSTRYYLQPVNTGSSSGMLAAITVKRE